MFANAPGKHQGVEALHGRGERSEFASDPVSEQFNRKARTLVIADGIDGGVLQVVAQAATCDAVAEFPACHLTRQDWGVAIRVDKDGATRLPLVLRGLDAG